MAKLSNEICKCCGQTVARYNRSHTIKHAATIEKLYGYTLKDLKRTDKRPGISYARSHYWLLLVIDSGWSLDRAANSTKSHHTSVLHGIRRVGVELLGTSHKATIRELSIAYWTSLGLSEKEASKIIQETPSGNSRR